MLIGDREVCRRLEAVLNIIGQDACETDTANNLMDAMRTLTLACSLAMQPGAGGGGGGEKSKVINLSVMIHRDMMDGLRSFAKENPNCEDLPQAVAFILGAYLAQNGYFFPDQLPGI